jgi:hypothetical protein
MRSRTRTLSPIKPANTLGLSLSLGETRREAPTRSGEPAVGGPHEADKSARACLMSHQRTISRNLAARAGFMESSGSSDSPNVILVANSIGVL